MDDPEPAEASPLRVFLSYSRSDRTRALKVIKALESHGISVWWDGMLEVGQAFAHSTETALETADAVVVLWTRTSIQSHWVRDEATRGRDRGCMVPVLLDGSQPPLGFRQIQYIKLDHWRGKATAHEFEELVHAVRTAAAAPNTQLNFAAAAPRSSSPVSRRSALILGAGGISALGALAAWRSGLIGAGSADAVNSVAVLPFRNLSGDPAQSYFSDGLSEELRTLLSLNRSIEVAAETSTSALTSQGKDPRAISSALKVAYILDGSVRRSADMLRIAARLIDGKTGFEKWSQSFDRKAGDVLVLQNEIATYVADALAARVTAAADIGRTTNARAFDAYLRGLALYKKAESEATDRGALAAYDEAIAIDPRFALAHAARARALVVIASTYGSGAEIGRLQGLAREAANTAVRLAPDMAEGQFALGFFLSNAMMDQKGAALPFQRSVELGFGNADILTAYADFATNTGRFDEARKAAERAKRLDPLNPSVLRSAALLEFYSRNYAAAETALSAALALNPKVGVIHRFLGDCALVQGNAEQARGQYLDEPLAILRLPGLAIADFKLSGAEAGEARLRELIGQFGTNSMYQQVQIYAQWGRTDDALKALDQAVLARDAGLVLLRNDPLLDPVRSAQRFSAALQQLGFA
ncbi:TIR domain-containing protein [Novosphingobium sp.]|uniref:TIR domain-containing protein n=1 Tax=Novosphingobium sp. TaxID=1874826 RepID=UPI0025EF56D0|nr:TIR domain-containing protein [Novosphingobium sp.]